MLCHNAGPGEGQKDAQGLHITCAGAGSHHRQGSREGMREVLQSSAP